jgi:membrane protease YdiL (CAAX protease family)
MHEAEDERIGSLWVAVVVPLLMVGVVTLWAFTSWSKDCHAGPRSEITGWPYFALGLAFVVPTLYARQRGRSVWVSIGYGGLSAVLTIFLYIVMYVVYLGVYNVDLGACLG